MKKIEVILKVTQNCNLRCAYCYNSGTGYAAQTLSIEKFEKLLSVLLTEYNLIHIIWHGGEPLMAGKEFFRKAMDAENRIRVQSSVIIENSIQTNGTLIDGEWIRFFKQNKFRIGISFDGIENDKYRSQTQKVLEAMKKLRAAGLDFSCIAVVADDDYDLKANYRYFAGQGINFDFNQVFGEGAAKDMAALKTSEFAKAYNQLFDEWLYDTDGVNVRSFSFYVGLAVGGRFRICTCSSCHMKYLGVTPDGTLYNCGRAGVEAYPFGNIDDFETARQIYTSDGAIALIKGSIERRNKCKKSCEYFDLCGGGCADIAIGEGDLSAMPENYCLFFKTVYSHISQTVRGLFEKNVPLDTLNPAIRTVLAKSLTRMSGPTSNDVSDTYV